MADDAQEAEVAAAKWSWPDLYKLEDWWAVWLGAILLTGVFSGLVTAVPKMPGWTWGAFGETFSFGMLLPLAALFACLVAIFAAANAFVKPGTNGRFILGFLIIAALASLAYVLANESVVKAWGISYAFWALLIGLLISNSFGTPEWLKPAVRTEFYIKTGLVIMGAEILFGNIVKFGAYGLGIAWGVTPIIIIFMWFFGTRMLKMGNKPLVIVIATATSVCGVSAAIAAAAASRAKKDDLTIAVGMSLLFTVIMMVLMPPLVRAMGLPPLVGGAWIGGTIDATGAVVAAGEALGSDAEKAAAIVKMIQNILIGAVAFAIAIYWVAVVERNPSGPRPGISEVWVRLPKFILGFLAASLVASFIMIPMIGEEEMAGLLKLTKVFRGWLFCMAFVCIGLESNFKEMARQMEGGKPLVLYGVGQSFNIVLTLLVAWVLLSGSIFPDPPAFN